jgi:hypothetical protein
MIQKLDAAVSPFLIFKSCNYVGERIHARNDNFRGTSGKLHIFDNKLPSTDETEDPKVIFMKSL